MSQKEVGKMNKYMRKCSVSLVISEMQNKTALKFPLSEWLSPRIQRLINADECMGREENFAHSSRKYKLVQPL